MEEQDLEKILKRMQFLTEDVFGRYGNGQELLRLWKIVYCQGSCLGAAKSGVKPVDPLKVLYELGIKEFIEAQESLREDEEYFEQLTVITE